MRRIGNFIDGRLVDATGEGVGDVYDPATGAVQAQVVHASAADLERAVASAAAAQVAWARVNPQRRARVMAEFARLLEANMDALARLLSSEHGKVLSDARGDLQRGLEVVEFACGIPHLLKGEYTRGAGPGIDVHSAREPLGVVAGITPFNFPAMIPMWMFAPAIASGNAFILKPSERNPSVPLRLAELMIEAGLPAGVLNVLQGGPDLVQALASHPQVRAVSFVGSSDIAQEVYALGARHGKRVQCMGGAKNHGIVLPDADLDQVVQDLLGAAYGSAGERCMALPVVVAVGEATAEALRARLVPAIAELHVGAPTDPAAHFGPLITGAHRERVAAWIQTAVDEGAELVVDGRGLVVPGMEQGFFLGATLLDHVTDAMSSWREEIFGPVLQMMRVDTFEEALALPSAHQYGNGVAIFTRDGGAAREFADRVEVGMVGINVPIPVPVAYHSFGGWKRSAFGDLNQYGMEGVRFYTRTKVVTSRWPGGGAAASSFVIPTMQ